MADRYRVDSSIGGGYTVRRTDYVEGAMLATAGVAGTLMGAAAGRIARGIRNSRDAQMQSTAKDMLAAAELKEFDRLGELATTFIRRYPQEPHGYACLALALTSYSQYDDAFDQLDRAVEFGWDPAEAVMLRATACMEVGAFGAAIACFSILLRDQESRHIALVGRAKALVRIADNEQAMDDVNTAIATLPDSYSYCLRGDLHAGLGNHGRALDDYTRAAKIDTTWVEPLEKRAATLRELGRGDEAGAEDEVIRRFHEQAYGEAREVLRYLRGEGLTVTLSDSGSELRHEGRRLRPQTLASMVRLRPYLVQILAIEAATGSRPVPRKR